MWDGGYAWVCPFFAPDPIIDDTQSTHSLMSISILRKTNLWRILEMLLVCTLRIELNYVTHQIHFVGRDVLARECVRRIARVARAGRSQRQSRDNRQDPRITTYMLYPSKDGNRQNHRSTSDPGADGQAKISANVRSRLRTEGE